MLICYATPQTKNSTAIHVIAKANLATWLGKQKAPVQQWVKANNLQADNTGLCLIPDSKGGLDFVLFVVESLTDFWAVGGLPFALPPGDYHFDHAHIDYQSAAIVWGLGAYQFTRYKAPTKKPARLVLSKSVDVKHIMNTVESTYLIRSLINTPTDDMGPSELAAAAVAVTEKYPAKVKQIVGDQLRKQGFHAIHAVGRASDDAPRLVDVHWGNPKHPKLTLVGKGVCFDTGGLDLKPASAMALMKKDMGGAAHVLGLARMIMEAELPVYLRLLMPMVENAVAGNAYRPGDVIQTHKGITVEIDNTDAEGRLVLCDALSTAVQDKPDLIIDIATLTGAAKVATGTDLPALFCNQDKLANDLIHHANLTNDPMWRMPLHTPYRSMLNSSIANIKNSSPEPWAGAITAALFLQEFVPNDIPWAHFDIMAWNTSSRPGRPQGAEAVTLRALFSYCSARFKK